MALRLVIKTGSGHRIRIIDRLRCERPAASCELQAASAKLHPGKLRAQSCAAISSCELQAATWPAASCQLQAASCKLL
jgi:hypothetical protein